MRTLITVQFRVVFFSASVVSGKTVYIPIEATDASVFAAISLAFVVSALAFLVALDIQGIKRGVGYGISNCRSVLSGEGI